MSVYTHYMLLVFPHPTSCVRTSPRVARVSVHQTLQTALRTHCSERREVVSGVVPLSNRCYLFACACGLDLVFFDDTLYRTAAIKRKMLRLAARATIVGG